MIKPISSVSISYGFRRPFLFILGFVYLFGGILLGSTPLERAFARARVSNEKHYKEYPLKLSALTCGRALIPQAQASQSEPNLIDSKKRDSRPPLSTDFSSIDNFHVSSPFDVMEKSGPTLLQDIFEGIPLLNEQRVIPLDTIDGVLSLEIGLMMLPSQIRALITQGMPSQERQRFQVLSQQVQAHLDSFQRKNEEFRMTEEATLAQANKWGNLLSGELRSLRGMTFEAFVGIALFRMGFTKVEASNYPLSSAPLVGLRLAAVTFPDAKPRQMLSATESEVDFVVKIWGNTYWIEAKTLSPRSHNHPWSVQHAEEQLSARRQRLAGVKGGEKIQQIAILQFDLGDIARNHLIKAGASKVIYLFPKPEVSLETSTYSAPKVIENFFTYIDLSQVQN